MPPVNVADSTPQYSKIIGASLSRVDGPLKTTGTAEYAADYHFPRMTYAVPVCATIANGKIRSLDCRRSGEDCRVCYWCCITETSVLCIASPDVEETARTGRHSR